MSPPSGRVDAGIEERSSIVLRRRNAHLSSSACCETGLALGLPRQHSRRLNTACWGQGELVSLPLDQALAGCVGHRCRSLGGRPAQLGFKMGDFRFLCPGWAALMVQQVDDEHLGREAASLAGASQGPCDQPMRRREQQRPARGRPSSSPSRPRPRHRAQTPRSSRNWRKRPRSDRDEDHFDQVVGQQIGRCRRHDHQRHHQHRADGGEGADRRDREHRHQRVVIRHG